MRSPMYYAPMVYEFFTQRMHSPDRYDHIIRIVGGKSVLELGCGTGILQEKLGPKTQYMGIDLNHEFVEHGKRNGRNVRVMDINHYEPKAGDGWEVVVLIDVLHHLPHYEKLLGKLIGSGKEVIVCEPFHSLPSFLRPLLFIVDSDGINDIRQVKWHDRDSLLEFTKSRGAGEVVVLNDSLIAVFNKKNGNGKKTKKPEQLAALRQARRTKN
jgi:SAM-dependent methyltransferase